MSDAAASRLMIAIGLVLICASLIQCILYFGYSRDVTMEQKGERRVIAVLVPVALLSVIIVYSILIFNREETVLAGELLLFFSAVITLLIRFMITQMDGLKKRTLEILKTFITIIEAGDPNLDGHSLHVHNLSMLIYDYLPFKYRLRINRENLRYASLFLDLGKLGVPRNIIHKAGKLGSEEWKIMRRHPEICAKILKPLGSFEGILDWILYHHERVDGSGYYKKKGDDIPLPARIIAVADTYSAITMNRSYKVPMSYEDAIRELKLVSGKQLDTEIVEIFCNIPKNQVISCIEDAKAKMQLYQDEHFRD